MSVELMPAPTKPYPARFELRAIEDKEKSIGTGHFVAKNVEYIRIRTGTNSEIEREIRPDDIKRYKEQYEEWKSTLETPANGTAIRSWCVLSPADIMVLLNNSIKTVEDLSKLDDETCSLISPMCKGWRDKAINWLETAEKFGKMTETVNGYKAEIKSLKKQLEDKEATIQRLMAKISK